MQAALPSKVFSKSSQIFNIKQEMFASPFNYYFNSYCSAFYDTDYYFGSMGSFFNCEPNDDDNIYLKIIIIIIIINLLLLYLYLNG